MEGKSNFLKRPALRSKSHHQLNISALPTRTLSTFHTEESSLRIKKESIKDFAVIGIFDRKVIVSFNSRLKIFGNFDLHAVHERIRYEFYCWKIRSENWVTAQISPIEATVV
jgi:DNA mismatch repair ATPase MutL